MSDDPFEPVDNMYNEWTARMQVATGSVRRDYLSNKANWTPLMIHIQRTAMMVGLVLGVIMGILIGYGLMS